MNIDTDKYIKVLKENGVLDYVESENISSRSNTGLTDDDILRDNVLIGIILYFYIISGTKGELARSTSTKIKHIKLLRDCTRWENYTILHLRAAKILVEAFMYLDFINKGEGPEAYGTFDIKDIGICLRDELAECYSGNMDTLMAKVMLLGEIPDRINAYLFTRK